MGTDSVDHTLWFLNDGYGKLSKNLWVEVKGFLPALTKFSIVGALPTRGVFIGIHFIWSETKLNTDSINYLFPFI